MKLKNVKTGKEIGLDDDLLTRWKEAERIIDDFERRYFDLVWYARRDKDELLQNEWFEALIQMLRIEKEWKDDVNNLVEDPTNWTHGFNSGMLAAMRLVKGMMYKDVMPLEADELDEWDDNVWLTESNEYVAIIEDDPLEDFPFLDT
jgi:hypothetical protein